MAIPRIYQPVSLQPRSELQLDSNAAHHVFRVLRMQAGEQVLLFNSQAEGDYHAVIQRIDKKGVWVQVGEFIPAKREAEVDIYLAQGIARGEKMDMIIQKAVELGVKKIFPLITERCNVRLTGEREEKRLAHWQGVVISACEQSGRNQLPSISPPADYADWLSQAKAEACFILSPHTLTKMPPAGEKAPRSIIVLVGPEGGFSENEVQLAIDHGFTSLNLGPRILRTETASLAALTVMQYAYGDMQ